MLILQNFHSPKISCKVDDFSDYLREEVVASTSCFKVIKFLRKCVFYYSLFFNPINQSALAGNLTGDSTGFFRLRHFGMVLLRYKEV